MKYLNAAKKYGPKVQTIAKRAVGGLVLASPMLAHAEAAQPDTAEAVAYVAAGVATYLLVANAKYIFAGVQFVSRKVAAAFGR